jgi:glycosyltransferase involved in cell wall biosynthesis
LESAINQDYGSGNFEVLIVDNNSTDETRDVLNGWMSRYRNIRLLFEPKQGLSHARNLAYKKSKGEIIVYIDDDAQILPDYLMNLEKVFDGEEKVGAVGGPIEIRWLGPVPQWYEPCLDGYFNHLYLGSYRRRIRYPEILYGTNFAFPVRVLERIGGFNPALGRKGKWLWAGEEAEAILKIEKKTDLNVYYDPLIKVRHLLDPARLNQKYLLEKAFWHGRSQCRVEQMYPGSGGIKNALFGFVESYGRTLIRRTRGKLTELTTRELAKGYFYQWIHHKRASWKIWKSESS